MSPALKAAIIIGIWAVIFKSDVDGCGGAIMLLLTGVVMTVLIALS